MPANRSADGLGDLSGQLARLRKQKAKLEVEIGNLTAAVAQAGHSSALLSAVAQHEGELANIRERPLSKKKGSIEAELAEMRRFVTERLGDLRNVLSKDAALARTQFGQHVREITMKPDLVRGHYVASG